MSTAVLAYRYVSTYSELATSTAVLVYRYVSTYSELAMCIFPSSLSYVMIPSVVGNYEEGEENGRRPRPLLGSTETHAAYETVKPFLSVHCIGTSNGKYLPNLQSALFHLQRKFSTKEIGSARACLNPVRYKYPTHPNPCHTSSTCL